MSECEVCRGARRAFETLAGLVKRASVPLPRERTELDVLVDHTREKILAATHGDGDGHDARAQRAPSARCIACGAVVRLTPRLRAEVAAPQCVACNGAMEWVA